MTRRDKRVEIHAGPDSQGRYRYTLYRWADYHPGHPDGEHTWRERGQCFHASLPEDVMLPGRSIRDVAGYQFLLRYTNGSAEWCYLQGSGGRIGDGTLCVRVRSFDNFRAVCDRLLARTRAELAREGHLLKHAPPKMAGRSFSTERVTPVRVEAVAPVGGTIE